VKDFLYAARLLRKNPMFTLTAALSIALGIGASTAIFSVTNAVLLRPLPYKDPERLVSVWDDRRARNVKDYPFSNATFLELRNGARMAFEDIAAVSTGRGPLLRADGIPEQVRTATVTPNFFRLMGAAVAVGRDFSDSDGQPQPQASGTPVMVVLSYEYWQRRYGGSTAILDHPIGASALRVVGVLAPRFELLFPPSRLRKK
jgi:putative ABC transport system permease protein